MPQHIAQWNPTTQLWETDQIDLFSGRSEPYSVTFPTSGMTRSGALLPLPASGHRIGGSGFSSSRLLPTPTSGDEVGTGYATSWEELTQANGRHRLRDAVTVIANMLPTPPATDGTKGGPNQRGSSGDLMLPSAVMNLDG